MPFYYSNNVSQAKQATVYLGGGCMLDFSPEPIFLVCIR